MAKKLVLGSAFLMLSMVGLPFGAAHALTAKECSAKYQQAKEAGSLGGQSWTAFRKAQCSEAKATAATASANPLRGNAQTKEAVFPTALASEFAALKPAQARRQTCAKQFKANKASGANGGLRWIETGGGYYSQCNKRLKSA